MENVYKQQPGLFRLRAIAIWEWLMILPATLLLAAAALRMLQPRQYEPARTSWIIFEWTMTHVSRLVAAVLFIGMPGVVVAAGCAALLRNWRKNQALRNDVTMTVAIVRRHFAFSLLAAAVLLAGTILAAVAVHMVTD
jgi:hypothetical protein